MGGGWVVEYEGITRFNFFFSTGKEDCGDIDTAGKVGLILRADINAISIVSGHRLQAGGDSVMVSFL